MTIGVLHLKLLLHDTHSLKQKRGVVKKVLERTRARFNIAAAEVGQNDIHTRATLAFVTVSNDSRQVNSALDKVLNFIEGLFLAEIVDHEIELIHYS
jgi:hypothetical protein